MKGDRDFRVGFLRRDLGPHDVVGLLHVSINVQLLKGMKVIADWDAKQGALVKCDTEDRPGLGIYIPISAIDFES